MARGICGMAVALGLVLPLAACMTLHGHVTYEIVGETFHVDPISGHLIRTTAWEDTTGHRSYTEDEDITVTGIEPRRTTTRREQIEVNFLR